MLCRIVETASFVELLPWNPEKETVFVDNLAKETFDSKALVWYRKGFLSSHLPTRGIFEIFATYIIYAFSSVDSGVQLTRSLGISSDEP